MCTVVEQFQGFILVQDRAGREQTVSHRQVGSESSVGQQARSRQREGRRADRESGTGEQTGRQGLDVGREVRQAKGR